MKDAAIKIAVHNVFHIGAKKAILLGEPIIIDLSQDLKILLNTLIIRECLRVAWLIDSRCIGHRLSSLKQDITPPDNKYCKNYCKASSKKAKSRLGGFSDIPPVTNGCL
jgi:hypothetical protein